ncbi:uncharacterized protein LOC123523270 isoform X2 [Mercenaria mercenaria]|uniref:uncharacterized protein LOC123523270 isoform X2 n=1 Tax=Mercenaria mercenaria TaxID=6596 RepID=UPI00234FA5AF|nr:uncharacterized protein LOC123523270 isoform X2 [Mercenaria mercenaria]
MTSRTKFIQTWIGETSPGPDDEVDEVIEYSRCKTPDKHVSFSTTPVSQKKRQLNSDQSDDCVLVHIDNLVQPADDVCVRPLDFNHVSVLEKSFLKQQGQISIMVGSVPVGTDISVLSSPGMCEVQVLGGNHSRTALQSLNRKGLLHSKLVKMQIYAGLSTEDALQLGVHHNEVNTLSKELSFIEKVRLIRSMMPCSQMSPADIRVWKIKLKTVFGYEKIRQVSHNLKHHLAVARLSEDLYEKILQIDEAWSNGRILKANKKPIGQTFFKGWMRVEDTEDQVTCLAVLLNEGYTAFKKKVEVFTKVVGEQRVRPPIAVSEDEHDNDDDDVNMEEVDKAENSALRDELKRLKENQKEEQASTVLTKKRKLTEDIAIVNDTSAVSFSVGDSVSALWIDKNGEEWNDAKVEKIYTNGDYLVRYWDNVKQRVKASRVKVLNTKD